MLKGLKELYIKYMIVTCSNYCQNHPINDIYFVKYILVF